MPNPAAASGDTRPAATGRVAVRRMRASISRSSTWLSALAPPDESASPNIVARARPIRGTPSVANAIAP